MKAENSELNDQSNANGSNNQDEQAAKSLPKDAQVMASMLRDMGITEWEPRVINQLMEFSYNYVTTVLEDAKLFSSHARKKTIDVDDVRLAVQMYADQKVTTPPTRDLLQDVAREKNASSLPIPKSSSGLRLPPDRFCLNAANYKLKATRKQTNSRQGPYYYGSSAGSKKQVMPNNVQTFTMTPGGGLVQQNKSKVQIQTSASPTVFTMTVNPNAAAIKRKADEIS